MTIKEVFRWSRPAFLVLALAILIGSGVYAYSPATAHADVALKNLIYDEAELLSSVEKAELNTLANKYSADRETDFIVFTTNNTDNMDVLKLTQDFYDDRAPGYDKAHGNAAILTIDMRNRDLYLAGFYKGETYLDYGRLDKIRDKISPSLTSGEYASAIETYIRTAHRYMGFEPGVNPDNILFNGWFQLAAAIVIGGLVVWWMAHNSGGRVTVQRKTYEDAQTSGMLAHRDQFIRTTVTKVKIQKPSGSSGGGGGGRTGGGHSHSGSRGSF